MKPTCAILFVWAVTILPSSSTSQTGLLKIGDSIPSYMKRNLVRFSIPMGDISNWPEGQHISAFTYQRGVDSSMPSFLVSRGIPFGVLQGIPPHAYYLFDTDGDGALDYKSEEAILPIWLVSYTSKVRDSSSTEFKSVLDTFFSAFQSDSGLILNSTTKPAFDALSSSAKDTTLANRDLFYMFSYYFEFTEKDASQALVAMKALEHKYELRFHSSHPVIALYLLETSLQLEDPNAAREYLSDLLKEAPSFIPGKYYSYVLEVDQRLKQSKAEQLKKQYPNHWIIKHLSD